MTTKEEPKKAPTLAEKLAQVMEGIGWVEKRGRNTFHNYDYVTESDLVEAVRKQLIAHGIITHFNVVSTSRELKDAEKGGYLTDVVVEWTFEDIASGETRTSKVPGCGEDKGDKGLYKAITGSEKYWLKNTFLIPTGGDPERDSGDGASPQRAPEQPARPAAQLPRKPQTGRAQLSPQQKAKAQAERAPESTDTIQVTGTLVTGRKKSDSKGSVIFAELDGKDLWCREPELIELIEQYDQEEVIADVKNVNPEKPNSFVVEAIDLA